MQRAARSAAVPSRQPARSTSAAFTSPGTPAPSMVAESTRIPFCCDSRASQATSASKDAFCSRSDSAAGPAGSLPASAPASPDSRAERSTITSSDSPPLAGARGATASSPDTLCIHSRSVRFFRSRAWVWETLWSSGSSTPTMSSTGTSSAPSCTMRRSRAESCARRCSSASKEKASRDSFMRMRLSSTLRVDLHASLIGAADGAAADQVRLPAAVAQLLAQVVEDRRIGRIQRELEESVVEVERLHGRAGDGAACRGKRLQRPEQAVGAAAAAQREQALLHAPPRIVAAGLTRHRAMEGIADRGIDLALPALEDSELRGLAGDVQRDQR